MQTFDYKVNDVMEHIIETKVDEIWDRSLETRVSSALNLTRVDKHVSKWYSSHERAKAVVLALPRNDAEMENWK